MRPLGRRRKNTAPLSPDWSVNAMEGGVPEKPAHADGGHVSPSGSPTKEEGARLATRPVPGAAVP